MSNKTIDNDDQLRFELEMNAMNSAPIMGNHRRCKEWAAAVEKDPESPGGLSRDFWSEGGGDFLHIVPADLERGDVIEFAADYYTASGKNDLTVGTRSSSVELTTRSSSSRTGLNPVRRSNVRKKWTRSSSRSPSW